MLPLSLNKERGRKMNKTSTPEDVASRRMMLIAPLLEEGLDDRGIIELKKRISSESDLSYRTISRYLDAYRADGFSGLKPKTGYKRPSSTLPKHFDELLEQAIILRRELPSRSVSDIIRILELEEMVKPGELSRSTLQRHLQSAGFGARQMKIYTQIP